jgi:hypothetical protein
MVNADMNENSSHASIAIPAAAKWLGGLGALPFVVFALCSTMLDGLYQAQAWYALAVYGAVILSFLGGVHWGMAIAEFGTQLEQCAWRRLLLSVVPSIIGWIAMMISTVPGLLLMAASFGLMLWIDLTAARKGEAPSWYPKLRWPLSMVVIGCLLLGATA